MREAELKVTLKFMESNHVSKRGTWGVDFQLVRVSISKIRTYMYFDCLKAKLGETTNYRNLLILI